MVPREGRSFHGAGITLAVSLAVVLAIATVQAQAPRGQGDGSERSEGRKEKRPTREKADSKGKNAERDDAHDKEGLSALRRMMSAEVERGGSPEAFLLGMAPVQEELKLTKAQKSMIKDQADVVRQAGRRMARQNGGFQGAIDPEALRQRMAAVQAQNDLELAQVLDPNQRARLHQIALQIEGPLSVGRPDVAMQLGLDETQIESVGEALAQLEAAQAELVVAQRDLELEYRQAVAEGQGSKSQLQSQMRKLGEQSGKVRDLAVKQVAKVLTPRQRKAFNAMLGEPYDLTKLFPADAKNDRDAPDGTDRRASTKSKTAKGARSDSDPDAPKDSPRPKRERAKPGDRTTTKSTPPRDDSDR